MAVAKRSEKLGFAAESEMLSAVLRWLARAGLQAKIEFVMPWGVCDVVATAFPEHTVQKRMRLGQTEPVGPAARVELLQAIPDASTGRSISLQRLQKTLGATSSELVPHLNALLGRKFITKTSRGSFQKIDALGSIQPRLLAIELKLDRVHDAIDQAVRNQAIARESFVAFPRSVAERVTAGALRHNVDAAGVGVLSVEGRNCSVLVQPSSPVANISPVLARHCVERFWRSYSKTVHH